MILEITWSQSGALLIGKNTPARKIKGKIKAWITTWKPCWERIREATRMPRLERQSETIATVGISLSSSSGVTVRPINGASANNTMVWPKATIEPPMALPRTTPVRLMGATSTSLRKPNSRSQTMETPAKREFVSTVMAMMPGYINIMKSTPGVSVPMMLLKPAPKIRRNISGKANDETMRGRSCVKRSSSR